MSTSVPCAENLVAGNLVMYRLFAVFWERLCKPQMPIPIYLSPAGKEPFRAAPIPPLDFDIMNEIELLHRLADGNQPEEARQITHEKHLLCHIRHRNEYG